MKYNFDEIVDRKNTNSAKYDEAILHYGTNDIINLWVADMDFRTAPEIIKAIQDKASLGIMGYTSRPDEYYEAFRNWKLKENDYEFDTKLMSHAHGVIPAMIACLKLFTNENDKVLVLDPIYGPFRNMVINENRQLVSCKLKNDNEIYTIDFEDLEDKIKDCKLILLCNPHNPVGRVWSVEELQKIGNLCEKYNVMVFSDEIHSDLVLTKKHNVFVKYNESIKDRVITFLSCSKTFNISGLQAAVIQFPNIEFKQKYDNYLLRIDIHRNNVFAIEAIIAALTYGKPWLEELLEYIRGNMKFVVEYIEKNIPELKTHFPEATYLCWINAKALNMTDEQLIEFFATKANVGLSSGITFGKSGSGYVRLNVACSRKILEKAMDNISRAIKER